MTSSKVQYLTQRLYERTDLDGQVPEGTAVQALHATFAAEALAHWAEVLNASLFPPHAARRRSVAVTADGTRMVSGSYDHIVRIWDLFTHKGPLEAALFAPVVAIAVKDAGLDTCVVAGDSQGAISVLRLLVSHP